MILAVAHCPNCGAAHNPLLHTSFRQEPGWESPDEQAAASGTSITYTWLCETCGETYFLEVDADEL